MRDLILIWSRPLEESVLRLSPQNDKFKVEKQQEKTYVGLPIYQKDAKEH